MPNYKLYCVSETAFLRITLKWTNLRMRKKLMYKFKRITSSGFDTRLKKAFMLHGPPDPRLKLCDVTVVNRQFYAETSSKTPSPSSLEHIVRSTNLFFYFDLEEISIPTMSDLGTSLTFYVYLYITVMYFKHAILIKHLSKRNF